MRGCGPKRTFSCDELASGYHAYGEGECLLYHRGSLPRLLHGSNSKLIKGQNELNSALERLNAKATELGYSLVQERHFTRVDLAWQFYGDPALFVLAHRNCRHQRIRSAPVSYEEQARSLALKGSEMRINIYDKLREQSKRNGNVVRVEIQLKGERLMQELGKGDRVVNLNFQECYQAYRRILLGFIPNSVPRLGGISHLLAIAELEGWESNGVSAWDLYTQGMCERHLRRLRRDMAALRPDVFQLDWNKLLPEEGPPPPLEL